ncbi:MAG: hypothetical protein M3O55_01115 [Actinomycetota bacterium]|nr:hypothetical protein [Actinomycetota bacterium]
MVIESSRTAVAITTAERCDRCGARAFVRTTFAAGDELHDLLWCGHHFAAHEARIREQAVFVQDERDSIDEPIPSLDWPT